MVEAMREVPAVGGLGACSAMMYSQPCGCVNSPREKGQQLVVAGSGHALRRDSAAKDSSTALAQPTALLPQCIEDSLIRRGNGALKLAPCWPAHQPSAPVDARRRNSRGGGCGLFLIKAMRISRADRCRSYCIGLGGLVQREVRSLEIVAGSSTLHSAERQLHIYRSASLRPCVLSGLSLPLSLRRVSTPAPAFSQCSPSLHHLAGQHRSFYSLPSH